MYELIESQRRVLQLLESIGNRHPHDVEVQRSVAQANGEVAAPLIRMNELLGYRDAREEGTNGHEAAD